MATKVTGDYEDFKKAIDKINPDPTTHYNKKLPEEYTQEKEAIKTLIIGCRLAQEKGVYTLEEAKIIMNAIDFLNELNTTK